MLSGLIRCSRCGSNYTISGKDYYRCTGQKERGICGNRISVRKGSLETATLAALQEHLLTEHHARLFAEEFEHGTRRLGQRDRCDQNVAEVRLKQLETELANL